MDKQRRTWVYRIVMAVISAVVAVVCGIVFSLCTGYKSTEQTTIIKLLVWGVNIIVAYSIAYGVYWCYNRDNEKWERRKYFDVFVMGMAYLSSVVIVALLGDFEYGYVVTAIAITGLWGVIWGLFKWRTAKDKKEKRKSKKKESE